MPRQVVTIRIPPELLAVMPKASLRGTRSQYILEAINMRLVSEGKLPAPVASQPEPEAA